MFEQIFHESDIGADTANPKFAQRPIHPRNCRLWCRRPSGDLFQQTIIIAGNDSARVGRAAIEANAHARGTSIGRDAPIVGDEIV